MTSILFPIFASYKALRTSDPANLAPWLMYWTTLSLLLLAESQLYVVLIWIPFYPWVRLAAHLYLVLPGQQGSVFIYKQYIHPFLEEHERQIDQLISEGHAKAKAAGMDMVKQGIEYVRVQLLGQPPKQPTPPPSRNVSYSTYLINRFAMPSARQGLAAAGTSDLFGLLGKAIGQATYPDSRTRDEQAEDLAASGTLIPPSLSGAARSDYVNTQRERLRTLLQAFDAEAYHNTPDDYVPPRASMPRPPSGAKSQAGLSAPMHASRSESDFEELAYEPTPMPDPEEFILKTKKGGGAGWSNWVWGSHGEKDSVIDTKKEE